MVREALILLVLSLCTLSSTGQRRADAAGRSGGGRTYVVDCRLSADEPSRGLFKSLKVALRHLESGTAERHATLVVRPGVYWLDDPDDPEVRRAPGADKGIPFADSIVCSYLDIVGSEADPKLTVWAVNRGQTQGAEGNFTMLKVVGHDISARGITFGNYCNVDLDYPQDDRLSRKRRADAIVQAQLAICYAADRLFFKDCRFVSRLNMCPFVGARRTVYEDCHFECTDDALNGAAIYHRCHFDFFSGKPFYSTSRTGSIFLDCDIDSHVVGRQCFTKTGGPLALVDVRIRGEGVSELRWSSGDEDYVSYVSGVTLNGSPADIDTRRRTVDLTDQMLLWAYKSPRGEYNIAGLASGDDGWNPTGQARATEANRMPTTLELSPSKRLARAQGDEVGISIVPLRWGGYGPKEARTEVVRPENRDWRTVRREVRLENEICDGLCGFCSFEVEGLRQSAPIFKSKPAIGYDKRRRVFLVDYALSRTTDALAGAAEASVVRWYRVSPSGERVAVKESSDAEKKMSYEPTDADVGSAVEAEVAGRYDDTEACAAELSNALRVDKGKSTREVSTDFSDVAIGHAKDLGVRGVWLMDAYKPQDTEQYAWRAEADAGHPAWRYGRGFDGAQRVGLVTERRGARLTYTPNVLRPSAQRVEVELDPCKPAGQGFGSATGQYFDIRLMFDPSAQSGYALRIYRTPEHDKAVEMVLLRYEGGVARRLCAPAVTKDFKAGCRVVVSVEEGMLRATLSRDGGQTTTLTAPAQPTGNASVQLQHTGSVGSNGLVVVKMVVVS